MARSKKAVVPVDQPTVDDSVSADPVTVEATDNFSLVMNGVLCSFVQGQSIVADAAMQAEFSAHNAPVA